MNRTDKIIWAVTSGEYSDYGVEAIFSTLEAAQYYVAVYNRFSKSEKFRVEHFPLNPESVLLTHPDLMPYRVYFDKIGAVSNVFTDDIDLDEGPTFLEFSEGGGLVTLWAKTEELAKKIAIDFRAKKIAEQAGL